jgi:hypothetical protein
MQKRTHFHRTRSYKSSYYLPLKKMEQTKLFNNLPVKWKFLPSPNYEILKFHEIITSPTTVLKDVRLGTI